MAGELSRAAFIFKLPLRRAAGERVGPIAKRWEGEVVLQTKMMVIGQGT
jgi:hypothetical protein